FPSKWSPWRFAAALVRLYVIVRRHRIELIHCNEEDTYPIGGHLGQLCGIPTVLTCHFALPADFARWAFGRGRGPKRVFFVSHSSRERWQASISHTVPAEHCRVIHNGLNLDRYCVNATLRASYRASLGV